MSDIVTMTAVGVATVGTCLRAISQPLAGLHYSVVSCSVILYFFNKILFFVKSVF